MVLRRWFTCVVVASIGCGRIGFDAALTTGDAGSADGAARDGTLADGTVADGASLLDGRVPDGGPVIDLPGESVVLPPGWSADVWIDFSDRFTYDDAQFPDPPLHYTNRPHHMFLIPAPFAPGIGLVASWEVYELRDPNVFVEHVTFPGAIDMEGPDALWDAVFCGDYLAPTAGMAGICLAGGSQNSGDGIYRLELDWSLTRTTTDNNVGDMEYDETGAFDAVGAPALYWAGPDGLRRHPGAIFLPGNFNGAFTELLPSGDFLTRYVVTATNESRLVILSSGSHAETPVFSTTAPFPRVNQQNDGIYVAVTGESGRLGGFAYAIVGAKEIHEIDATGASTVVASTSAADPWMWSHAIVPPASHPLGALGPVLYVLEVNPVTETNRVIRLRPPGGA